MLRDSLDRLAKDLPLQHRDNPEMARPEAFPYWCAELYASCDPHAEGNAEDAVACGSRDLGADFVFEDPTQKHLIIGQCKYVGQGKEVPEEEVVTFFTRDSTYRIRDWVRKHGSPQAQDLLCPYEERVAQDWKISYWFFSTGTASPRVREIEQHKNREYKDQNRQVECSLYDFSKLKALYAQSLSVDSSIPDTVEFGVSPEKSFLIEEPFRTVVAVVKGNVLRDLYGKYKQALFAYNIRGYLGGRGINSKIIETAEKSPEHFFYFNNGISAIATRLEFEDGRIRAEKFQVINGAQTLGALYQASQNSSVDVLIRISQTQSVSTDKGFNHEIIRCNNTQNVVKVSDFRANDPIHRWLSEQFRHYNGRFPCVPTITYMPKRGSERAGKGSKALKLEDLAKIRYAFIREPTLGLSHPKDLWSDSEDGVYDVAFGGSEGIAPHWTSVEFEELLLAIALFYRFDEATRVFASTRIGDEDAVRYRSFNRLKYHALALAGEYWRHRRGDKTAKQLLSSKDDFTSFFDVIWNEAKRQLQDAYDSAQERNVTAYAMARQEDAWKIMKRKFITNVAV